MKTLREFFQALLARMDNPIGPIHAHLQSLGDMPPELARINMVRFEVELDTGGAEATSPDTVRLNPEFDAEIFGLCLYEQDPANDHDDAPLVTFNTVEDGRGRNLFKSDWSMGLIPDSGVSQVFTFPRGLYRISKGATLKTSFSVNSSYATTNNKRWGVIYLLNEWRNQGDL